MDNLFVSICAAMMLVPIIFFFVVVTLELLFGVDLIEWLNDK